MNMETAFKSIQLEIYCGFFYLFLFPKGLAKALKKGEMYLVNIIRNMIKVSSCHGVSYRERWRKTWVVVCETCLIGLNPKTGEVRLVLLFDKGESS